MSDIPMHSKALNQLSPQELTEEIRHLAQQVPGMVDLELCGTWTDDGVSDGSVHGEYYFDWQGSRPLARTLHDLEAALAEWRARNRPVEDDGVDQCPVEWEEIPWLT